MEQNQILYIISFCSDSLEKFNTGVSIEIVSFFFSIHGFCTIALVVDNFVVLIACISNLDAAYVKKPSRSACILLWVFFY